jgi:hypothetical protein
MYEAALGLSVLCFLAVTAYYVRSPAFSVFHPMTFYCAFHGFLFVIRPIIARIYDFRVVYYAYQFTPSEADKITVIMAANLGFLAFSFFCLRVGGMPMRFSDDEAIREERRRLSQLFAWVVAITGPPAMYSMARTYSTTNSVFDGMSVDKSTGVVINTTQIGYILDLQLMAVSIGALLIWLARFRWWSFIPSISFILLKAGSGSRGPFVASIVSAGLFYMYEKRLRYPALKMILGAAAVVALFGLIGDDRGQSIRELIGYEENSGFTESTDGAPGRLEGMDFANMEYFEYLVYVIPQRSGTYDYFLDNFQVFTEPVPRILWPSKPVGEPFRRIWLFDYGFPIGMTRSLPGEGWYALGWVGVLIWCGLWGHVLGSIYRGFVRGPQTTFQMACYMVFIPTLVVAFRDGALLSIVRQTGVYFTPIAIWALLAKYSGVPNANQLRTMLAFSARRAQLGTGTADEPGAAGPARPTPAQQALAGLPPAVRRRRAMLSRSGGPAPTE